MIKNLLILFFLFLTFSCDDNNPVDNNVNDSTVTDIDGNVYHTIQIGDQIWAVENLRVENFNDGTPIPHKKENDEWLSCTTETAAYCYYENNVSYKEKYGALYNWYAVNSGKLAPTGWHVPADNDWNILQSYLIDNGYNWDGTTTENKIAKAMATKTDWSASDTLGDIGYDLSSNDSSGFCGLPGGYRNMSGDFTRFGTHGYWWNARMENIWEAHYQALYYDNPRFISNFEAKERGYSVRLVKD